MSVAAVEAVLDHLPPTVRGAARMVATVIAEHTNRQGWAWPGHDLIAERAACTERTVIRAIAQLAATEVDGRPVLVVERGNGRGRRSMYRLVLPGLEVAAPAPERATSARRRMTTGARKGDIHDRPYRGTARTVDEPADSTSAEEGEGLGPHGWWGLPELAADPPPMSAADALAAWRGRR